MRKSLLTVQVSGGHARFGMLETIRQFAAARLDAAGTAVEVRDGHARYFADAARAQRAIWDGPRQPEALEWVETEFANLRTAFRWSTSRGDLVTAASIAVLSAMLAFPLQRYEPAEWAEEILPDATAADLHQLPRLYSTAGLCALTGRPREGVEYAETAIALEADSRYEPSELGWGPLWAATAHAYAGDRQRFVDICAELATGTGVAHVTGMCGLTTMYPAVGRADEAMAIAEETVGLARRYGNPFWVACALYVYARAFVVSEPTRALTALREGLAFSREHRVRYYESRFARDAARLEAIHGQSETALELFDTAIDSFHHAGDEASLATTFVSLAVFFDRIGRHESAAMMYGASAHVTTTAVGHGDLVSRLRNELGDARFDGCTTAGAAMEAAEAVRYARQQIELARFERADRGSSRGRVLRSVPTGEWIVEGSATWL